MKTSSICNKPHALQGNVLFAVLVICTGMLIVSAAFFSTLTVSRRINHRVVLAAEAREGAEATLALASAELNRRAVAIASFEAGSLTSYALSTADKTFLAGTSAKSNLVDTSLGVKAGKFSANVRSGVTLYSNDPAYSRDDSKGITLGVRYGDVYTKASTKDPMTGKITTAYVAGTIQLRERAWFNYGFFYNMDMEVFPGPPMHVKGAIHTNGDLYLGKDGTSDGLYLYRIATSAGHIYRGIKYCLKGYNAADGTLTGFENKNTWNTGTTHPGEGTGSVYVTRDGTNTQPTYQLDWDGDCLGTTNPGNVSSNAGVWRDAETNTWKNFLKDKSLNVDPFTPPDLPLYVPENFETATVELRNHGYAMIEPQLPYTASETSRYYGRKTVATGTTTAEQDATENLKFSSLAGLTIVVSDPDREKTAAVTGADYLVKMASAGYGIPWKLVWYKGSSNASAPINKENPPARGADGLPIPYELDPFALNDEVDYKAGFCTAAQVKMQRNLKALLRDCIVAVPYRDSGYTVNATFGTGTNSVNIATFPTSSDCGRTVLSTDTRYNQGAASWPKLSTGIATGTPLSFAVNTTAANVNSYAAASYTKIISAADSYPKSSTATAALNTTQNIYSGLYDRRQGFDGTVGTTYKPSGVNFSVTANLNSGLTGAMHVVYIDLQKLNWILNHSELWKHPTDGSLVYDANASYTNIIYVDLPSAAKTASRHGAATGVPSTEPDRICPAFKPGSDARVSAAATTPGPGYCVLLHKGGRLPRLPYNDTDRTPGFTLATNGPLYIKGNFNADGEKDTGNSLLPDSDASTATTSDSTLWYSTTYPNAEMPALVAADAVTLLSEGYSTANSNTAKGTASANEGTVKRLHGYAGENTAVDANFLEVSTAIVTGLASTIPDRAATGKNQQSGAINNLPRFQEDHGNQTVRYRGSMAALYECEVMTKRFIQGSHGYWFDPPTREWGYHQYLAAARYPPGTPVVRTARLINMREISAKDYADGPVQPSE